MIRRRSPSSLNPANVRVLRPLPAQSAPLFCENGMEELDTARNCGAIGAARHVPGDPCSRAVREEADLRRSDWPIETPSRSWNDLSRSTVSLVTRMSDEKIDPGSGRVSGPTPGFGSVCAADDLAPDANETKTIRPSTELRCSRRINSTSGSHSNYVKGFAKSESGLRAPELSESLNGLYRSRTGEIGNLRPITF